MHVNYYLCKAMYYKITSVINESKSTTHSTCLLDMTRPQNITYQCFSHLMVYKPLSEKLLTI